MEPAARRHIRDALVRFVNMHLQGKDGILHANALWVQGRICDIINGHLRDLKSDSTHPGTVYELTAVPGKSAYDLQFYLKVNSSVLNGNKLTIQDCGTPGWKMIKGGPSQYRDNGYLSPNKVRRQLQMCLRNAFRSLPPANEWDPDIIYSGNLVEGAPSTTFRLKRESVYHYDVDVVAVIKASDLSNGQDFDLVAKPFDGDRRDAEEHRWRMSWSLQEKKLLLSFRNNLNQIRKLILLRVMKVIKNKHAELDKFSSFVYLNALFWLHERYEEDEYWTEEQFANRFIDLIHLIRDALAEHSLRVYFTTDDINLLSGYSHCSVKTALDFLNGIIDRQDYMFLIN